MQLVVRSWWRCSGWNFVVIVAGLQFEVMSWCSSIYCCVYGMVHGYSIKKWNALLCKLFDLSKPCSLFISLESPLLIPVYKFTYLTLQITFWRWKCDLWTGILFNLLSLYFSGEALIILHHIVPSCCVQRKLNVPFQCMSSMPHEGHQSAHRVCVSVLTVCFLTVSVTAVLTLPIVYSLS